MKRESWSIISACFLGAFIGTLTALDIATLYGEYFWVVGPLFGGIVAYIAIDFRHFCAGVAHSYRKTIGWKPYKLYWQTIAAVVKSVLAVTTSMCLFSFLSSASIALATSFVEPSLNALLLAQLLGFLAAIFSLGGVAAFVLSSLYCFHYMVRGDWEVHEYERYLCSMILQHQNTARTSNPVALGMDVLFGIRHCFSNVAVGLTYVPVVAMVVAMKVFKALKAFTVGVFIYVHSERRTLCFVDAAIGASIGYAFGSAVIGAIAGTALGVINYEIVSVRWLKLASIQKPMT